MKKAYREVLEMTLSTCTPIQFDGVPDRIAMFPGGKIAFVEVKVPGEKPRPLQAARHVLLRRLGFRVYILDEIEKIGGMIDEIRTT